MCWISMCNSNKIYIYEHQFNIHIYLWITSVPPPPLSPKDALDLLAALVNGSFPQSSTLPTYAPRCLEPTKGASRAAAIDGGPSGPGQ